MVMLAAYVQAARRALLVDDALSPLLEIDADPGIRVYRVPLLVEDGFGSIDFYRTDMRRNGASVFVPDGALPASIYRHLLARRDLQSGV